MTTHYGLAGSIPIFPFMSVALGGWLSAIAGRSAVPLASLQQLKQYNSPWKVEGLRTAKP